MEPTLKTFQNTPAVRAMVLAGAKPVMSANGEDTGWVGKMMSHDPLGRTQDGYVLINADTLETAIFDEKWEGDCFLPETYAIQYAAEKPLHMTETAAAAAG